MVKKTVWVMVGDEAIVRVMQRADRHGALTPVHEFTDPAAHARESEHHRDALGRRAEGGHAAVMGGANATASAGPSERHQQGDAFARRVAEWLLRQLDDQRFDELHVAAAPRFLGALRRHFAPRLLQATVQQFDKDWTQSSHEELAERFFPPPPRR